jgi:hypothetical protein
LPSKIFSSDVRLCVVYTYNWVKVSWKSCFRFEILVSVFESLLYQHSTWCKTIKQIPLIISKHFIHSHRYTSSTNILVHVDERCWLKTKRFKYFMYVLFCGWHSRLTRNAFQAKMGFYILWNIRSNMGCKPNFPYNTDIEEVQKFYFWLENDVF